MKKRNGKFSLLLGGLLFTASAQSAVISTAISAVDFGSPSSFAFNFTTPVLPVTGLVSWTADVSGELIDGTTDGISMSPLSGSIFEFLIDGISVGSDTLGTLTSDFTGSYSGFYDCGAGCSSLGINIHFTGSGGGDTYSNVSTSFVVLEHSVTVPEPGVVAMIGLGLVGLGFTRRGL